MKRLIYVATTLLLLHTISSCSTDAQTEALATVWLMGSPTTNDYLNDSYLFEVTHNKSIKVTTGNIFYDTENRKLVYHSEEYISTKKQKVSNKDWAILTELVTELYKQDSDAIGSYSDAVEITAFINEKKYWSPFMNDLNSNEKLLELTNKLIKICKLD